MKKIPILLLLALFMFLLTAHATYAVLVPEPEAGEEGLWHVESTDRVYVYMRYTKYSPPEGDDEYQETNPSNHYTYNTIMIGGSNVMPFLRWTIENPDDTTYNYFRIHKLSGGVESVVFDGIADSIKISPGLYPDHEFIIQDHDLSEIARIDQTESFKAYWYTVAVESGSTIADLPATDGNMVDATDDPMGYLSIENINESTRAVDFSVLYDSVSYEVQLVLEDISFLEEVHHGWYYTIDDEKYFYFSYSSFDIFIDEFDEAKGIDWEGFTIWNLSTDEVTQIRSVYVLTHFIEDESHDVYAYFYTPDVIMDELISVTVSFRYRFEKVFGGYTAWEYPEPLILEKDASTASLTTWETQLFAGSAAAATALSALSLAASSMVWPALLVTGSALLIYSVFETSITGFRTEDISEIDRPVLSGAFVALLEEEWDIDIDTVNNTPHKLYLGQYQRALTNGIDLEGLANDGEYSYTEIIWRRDTQQYVATFDEIVTANPTFTLSDNLLPDEPLVDLALSGLKPYFIPAATIVFAIGGARQLIAGDFKKLGFILAAYIIVIVLIGLI